MIKRFSEYGTRFAALFVALMLCGGMVCVPSTVNPEDEGNVGIDPVDFPSLRVSGEPNDLFDIALDVVWFSSGRAELQGSIETIDDVDVFDLGPVAAGTRIHADVSSGNGPLDPTAALFDAQQRIILENDDRDYANGQYDPLIDHVMRYDTGRCYLAITGYPLEPTTGTYRVTIRKSSATIPDTRPQLIVLDFDGGSVSIPFDRTYNVGPFDAADISHLYQGQTDFMRNAIIEVVRNRFAGYNVSFVVTPDEALPVGDYSPVLFGGYNGTAFGVSEGVDSYNLNCCDDSIVFIETFNPTRFGRAVSVTEMATAIGNVAAHEIGHLLGLNHVTNPDDLMDTTGGARTLLERQVFMTSPLHHSIFPIGDQDGPLLLLETVGEN